MMPEENSEFTERVFRALDNERKERRHDIGELHNRIDQILQAIQDIKGKNGNGAISSMIVMATIIGSLFVVMQVQINAVNESSKERHSTTVRQSDYLDKKIEALDITLQREMRDVSAIRKVEIDSLDKMLQREIRLLNATQDRSAESMRRDLDRFSTELNILQEDFKCMPKPQRTP